MILFLDLFGKDAVSFVVVVVTDRSTSDSDSRSPTPQVPDEDKNKHITCSSSNDAYRSFTVVRLCAGAFH